MADKLQRAASVLLELRAEIGEAKESVAIEDFSGSWELNNLPTASISLPLGRDAAGEPAFVHRKSGLVTHGAPVDVYLRAKNVWNLDLPQSWGAAAEPPGIKIFSGKIDSISYTQFPGSAAYVLRLEHWLTALTETSAISASSHPQNPADFIFFNTFPAAGGALAVPGWTTQVFGDAPDLTNFVAGKDDLWQGLFHKLLSGLAAETRKDPIHPNLRDVSGRNQTRIREAFERMTNRDGDASVVDVRLRPATDTAAILEGLTAYLERQIFSGWANNTIWDKLVGELLPTFQLALVPQIDGALIIPWCGPLNLPEDQYVTITPDADWGRQNQLAIPSRIRAVAIAVPVSVGALGNAGEATFHELPALFPPAPGDRTGYVKIFQPPAWLSQPRHAQLRGRLNTLSNTTTTIPTAFDAGARPAGNPAEQAKLRAAFDATKNLLDRTAHALFVGEQFKNRVGELSTNLRFDISPGSQIRILPRGPDPIADDALNDAYYCVAMGVSLHIDTRPGDGIRTRTTVSVAHIHTAAERESTVAGTKLVPTDHPLYAKIWPGGGLLRGTPIPQAQ